MKDPGKVLIFFLVIALLFWNPLSFYLFYGSTDAYDYTIIQSIFWMVFLLGVFSIFMIKKKKTSKTLENLMFSGTFLAIFFGFLVFFNALVGLGIDPELASSNQGKGLIFAPNSKAIFDTEEFQFEANINDIGLRDRNFEIDKKDKFRVLCFGDSWTFGWGVQVENSWPKQLETFLHQKGHKNVEIINCGQGGQYTSTYKIYVSRAVPLLKPDMVIIGVNQLDDLSQLYENNFKTELSSNKQLKNLPKAFIKSSFGNYLLLLKKMSSGKEGNAIHVKDNWKSSSKGLIEDFSRIQKLRFLALDEKVQNLFTSGNLNTGLLNYYINFPDRIAIFNNPENNATKFAIQEMKKDFEEMKSICSEHGAKLVFANMPEPAFTGHYVNYNPNDVLNKYYLENNKIDSIYQSVANASNIDYVELTDHFISLTPKDKYFFHYDGHPCERGYKEIGINIGKWLIDNKLSKH